ncbi:MAG: methyltransferase, partial [Moorea sp. SIO4A1]|nr:methyltransferase [Moorena sp. SIO4A1]
MKVKIKHKIQFPPTNVRELGQDQVYFYLVNGESREKIRLHDYERIFEVPELYEQVVYERLKCQSPSIVVDILESAVSQGDQSLNELRVLDLGAGNGIVGEKLKQHGV